MGRSLYTPNPKTNFGVPYDLMLSGFVVYCDLEREFRDVLVGTYGSLSKSMVDQMMVEFKTKGIEATPAHLGHGIVTKTGVGEPGMELVVTSPEVFVSVQYSTHNEVAIVSFWYLTGNEKAKADARSILDHWVQGASENGIDFFTKTSGHTCSKYTGPTEV